MRIEASTEALKATGDVELQKLNVVPQTVFLKARTDPGIHSPRITNLRRGALDPLQKIVPSSPRNNGSRRTSIDQSPSGAPFEDLRRRLATINGSGSSLPNTPKSRLTALASPNGVGAVALPAASNITDMTPPLERPGSPSDSVISTTNSTTFRAMQRLQVGVLDGQKAAPAVGASTANATGLLEPAAAMRSDGSPEPSGHTSPISVSGTIRNPGRPRLAALTPISTYGA
jgi:phosphoinositide-3-kinase, regulatory subunit 4